LDFLRVLGGSPAFELTEAAPYTCHPR
jgi:hypothetical protein